MIDLECHSVSQCAAGGAAASAVPFKFPGKGIIEPRQASELETPIALDVSLEERDGRDFGQESLWCRIQKPALRGVWRINQDP